MPTIRPQPWMLAWALVALVLLAWRLATSPVRASSSAEQAVRVPPGKTVEPLHERGVYGRTPGATGAALVALVVTALPEVPEPGRTQLARWVARMSTVEGVVVLDARWLAEVLDDARAHPGENRAWVELLRVIVAGPLGEADLDRLTQVLAFPELDPALLEVALAGLLPTRGPLILPWAEELATASPALARPAARPSGSRDW